MFKKTTINFALLSKERIYFVFGSLVINIKPRVMLLFTVINFSVCFESARWWSFFLGHVIFGCYDLWVTTLQLIITWLFLRCLYSLSLKYIGQILIKLLLLGFCVQFVNISIFGKSQYFDDVMSLLQRFLDIYPSVIIVNYPRLHNNQVTLDVYKLVPTFEIQVFPLPVLRKLFFTTDFTVIKYTKINYTSVVLSV